MGKAIARFGATGGEVAGHRRLIVADESCAPFADPRWNPGGTVPKK